MVRARAQIVEKLVENEDQTAIGVLGLKRGHHFLEGRLVLVSIVRSRKFVGHTATFGLCPLGFGTLLYNTPGGKWSGDVSSAVCCGNSKPPIPDDNSPSRQECLGAKRSSGSCNQTRTKTELRAAEAFCNGLVLIN